MWFRLFQSYNIIGIICVNNCVYAVQLESIKTNLRFLATSYITDLSKIERIAKIRKHYSHFRAAYSTLGLVLDTM